MSPLFGPVRAASSAASTVGGRVLSTATRLVAVRPAAKPLHPEGAVVRGVLTRLGGAMPSGVEWLDGPGVDEVLVRQSRAVGLPDAVPDIHGLALRVHRADGEYGDVLLASTGLGRLSRYTLTASRSPYGRPLTTLLPYRTSQGPVLLSASWQDERLLVLAWAAASGPWHPFGELALEGDPVEGPDADVDFDPLRHELPGLTNYDVVRRLRQPAYLTARRTRRS